ncbi:cytochrome c biogenesis protein ResB [Metabacillus sp. GX 13764]|uniref:cytochrome c biogenesis protein ResB n=1 Tax=Metabacillus kandeliae TaxID=2900151 RepID=UPI001E62F5CC|nr:cytochrome c biogenesis protein ResB [Metabacillus kandeliae]MCD7033319.1 cytochrome c biogenesis protein ResB [Metabacillus kandeliae]
MEEVKCECGHINPPGTVLCEACGKPIGHSAEAEASLLLDMRYDGSARRSMTYNKTVVDKIWNFFSSVKVGIWLIFITLVASAVGTIFPQQMYIPPNADPEQFYKDQYGILGQFYYDLGLQNTFGSWWFCLLLASIGISLVICSLDRVIPLYRSLKKQGVTKNDSFLARQRLYGISEAADKGTLDEIKENLKKRRYKIREENGSILAEKGRFSRWGPYVNHIGLIIFLIGSMLRVVPGMYIDKMLWLREGETAVIPGTDGKYFLKNNSFKVEVYEKDKENAVFAQAIDREGDGTVAKNYQADVTLYERKGNQIPGQPPKLSKVEDKQIRVNEPLEFSQFSLYQVDFRMNELNKMKFSLTDKKTGKSFGQLAIDLNDPAKKYNLGSGYKVEIADYLPDFYFDSEGQPASKSRIPNNPVFVFKMFAPDRPKGETSLVGIQSTMEPLGATKYKLKFAGVETKNVTGLSVKKDLTLWLLALGGAIFMIGVCQGMYWNHRRIWIKRKGGSVWIAAHTNKNWYGLKSEINRITEGTSVKEPIDQREIAKVSGEEA